MIQMVDLGRQYLTLKKEIDDAVDDVLTHSHFILGPKVAELEKKIAAYHGVGHAIGVGNGTDALLLALRACGIGRGDEVITSPFTFIATAEVIAGLGATPVFADIDPDTFNIDPALIEKKITPRTRAILPVHLFGHPADMDPILAIAKARGLMVIEDCAQSFGAEYKGKKAGSFGRCGCFSFFPSKNLACCGDGGMIITDDEETANTVRMLRNHGSAVKYYHSMLGYNSRLDEIQASILLVKFNHIDRMNEGRRRAADLYRTHLAGAGGVLLPGEAPWAKHVYHQFTIRAKHRDTVMNALKKNDIASAVYYPLPLDRQEVFAAGGRKDGGCAVSDRCAALVLSLPMFPELTEKEVIRVCDVIRGVPLE